MFSKSHIFCPIELRLLQATNACWNSNCRFTPPKLLHPPGLNEASLGTQRGMDIPRWWQLKYFWNFHPEPWGIFPFWRAYFSNGLKPPTIFISLEETKVFVELLAVDSWKEEHTCPKFTSEFTTEKWCLEDDPFLLGWLIFKGYVRFPRSRHFFCFFSSYFDFRLFSNKSFWIFEVKDLSAIWLVFSSVVSAIHFLVSLSIVLGFFFPIQVQGWKDPSGGGGYSSDKIYPGHHTADKAT